MKSGWAESADSAFFLPAACAVEEKALRFEVVSARNRPLDCRNPLGEQTCRKQCAMARNNYSFEKRQRELAKKKKREDKRQQKAEARRSKAEGTPVEPTAED